MKYFFDHIIQLKKVLAQHNIAFFFDFDLTLSPLASNPLKAYLPPRTKLLLKKLAHYSPVTVVTGRSLRDIQKRVSLKNVSYSGNHGFEFYHYSKELSLPLSLSMKKALLNAKQVLHTIASSYPHSILEDKGYSIALGYRLVHRTKIAHLEAVISQFMKDFRKNNLLQSRLDKNTFEIIPNKTINKGTACNFILKELKKTYKTSFIPFYVGDSQTDEDAFKALRASGITIKIQKDSTSKAHWYLHNQKEINSLLECIIKIRTTTDSSRVNSQNIL